MSHASMWNPEEQANASAFPTAVLKCSGLLSSLDNLLCVSVAAVATCIKPEAHQILISAGILQDFDKSFDLFTTHSTAWRICGKAQSPCKSQGVFPGWVCVPIRTPWIPWEVTLLGMGCGHSKTKMQDFTSHHSHLKKIPQTGQIYSCN